MKKKPGGGLGGDQVKGQIASPPDKANRQVSLENTRLGWEIEKRKSKNPIP